MPQSSSTLRWTGMHQPRIASGGGQVWTCLICCTSLSLRWNARSSWGASKQPAILCLSRWLLSGLTSEQKTHRESSIGPSGMQTHSFCGKCTDSSWRFQSYFVPKSMVQNVHWNFLVGLAGLRKTFFATTLPGSRRRLRPLRDPRLSRESTLADEEFEVELGVLSQTDALTLPARQRGLIGRFIILAAFLTAFSEIPSSSGEVDKKRSMGPCSLGGVGICTPAFSLDTRGSFRALEFAKNVWIWRIDSPVSMASFCISSFGTYGSSLWHSKHSVSRFFDFGDSRRLLFLTLPSSSSGKGEIRWTEVFEESGCGASSHERPDSIRSHCSSSAPVGSPNHHSSFTVRSGKAAPIELSRKHLVSVAAVWSLFVCMSLLDAGDLHGVSVYAAQSTHPTAHVHNPWTTPSLYRLSNISSR